jgi:hypothetical protein
MTSDEQDMRLATSAVSIYSRLQSGLVKCAKFIKRSNCVVSHKEIEPAILILLAKHCQKTVETSQPPLNVLPVFIITEKSFWFNLFM